MFDELRVKISFDPAITDGFANADREAAAFAARSGVELSKIRARGFPSLDDIESGRAVLTEERAAEIQRSALQFLGNMAAAAERFEAMTDEEWAQWLAANPDALCGAVARPHR